MRRAVAACTSPELVFRTANMGQIPRDPATNDPLGLALDALHMS
jgi:hypothetical protein